MLIPLLTAPLNRSTSIVMKGTFSIWFRFRRKDCYELTDQKIIIKYRLLSNKGNISNESTYLDMNWLLANPQVDWIHFKPQCFIFFWFIFFFLQVFIWWAGYLCISTLIVLITACRVAKLEELFRVVEVKLIPFIFLHKQSFMTERSNTWIDVRLLWLTH